MIKIRSTRDALQHGLKALAYGRAGVGKTRLCASLPNPIILSAESGLLSIREFNLPYIQISTMKDLQEAYLWASTSREAQQFQSIAIDSISEIAEVVLANEKKLTRDPRKAYGEMADIMVPAIKSFRDLPGKHIYVSAKQGQIKDEATGALLFAPDAPGQNLPKELPYLFDEIFCLRIGKLPTGEEFRYLQTQPDLQYSAKDRSGALDSMEKPDLSYIIQKIGA